MDQRKENAGWTPVPEFGGWEEKGADVTNYTVVFSKARENRKQTKEGGVRHSSLGSEQELIPTALYHHHRQETLDDDPVMKKKRILTYINCCIKPN